MRSFFQIVIVAPATLLLLLGCAKFEGALPPSPSPSPVAAFKHEPLSWETSAHPERGAWSNALLEFVDEKFDELNVATDVVSFCPTYHSLSRNEKVNVWAEIFSGITYYECSWRPEIYSVDVGTANNRDTWSVGLLQLSVVDQVNYRFTFGFDFEDLQDPIKNLKLGVAIMSKQISKYGKIMIPKGGSGLYWAVIHPGGKYDKSASIQSRTRAMSLCRSP